MNIIIFILVLGILVFVHELGHFLFAKLFKVRVDEFGFGYPPRLAKLFTFKGTLVTLNWIPFGGFVKIFGESDEGNELSEEERKVSLVYKPRWQQILVMSGGILFNIVFAWILFSGVYMSGVSTSVLSAPSDYTFDETKLVVTAIAPNSPATESGLFPGDEIKEYYNDEKVITVTDEDITDISDFVNETGENGDTVGMVILRENKLEVINLIPQQGIVNDRYAVGINVDRVGEMRLPIHQAVWYGAKNTGIYLGAIAEGFWYLISGKISTDNVSGPVGIVEQIGDASTIGFNYLISFMALLSLNLAILNLIPFPALDGGRIAIIIIESIRRKRLAPRIVNWVNTIGFFALILLMLVITVKDIVNLF